MDSSIRHVSDLCDPLFSLLFQFLLSLLHAYPYSKISETLSNSLSSSQTCLRVSLSLLCLKKSHWWCSGYLSTEEWMWTNSVSAPTQMWLDLVIKFMKKKISCQRSSLCFIYSTKNYLFLSLLFFFFFFKADSFIIECFWDFYNGYEA